MTGAAASSAFDELLHGVGAPLDDIARRLRALILAVHPTATEIVRLGDRAASFGVGARKMHDAHTYVMPQRTYVNLGLYRGALLPDPEGLLEGTGTRMRHVKVRSAAEVDRPALCALVAAALDERRRALSLGE